MGRPRKEVSVDGAVELSPEVEEPKVAILSQRFGAVKAPCGTLISYQDVIEVVESSADWLEVSFPGRFRRVK